MEQIVVQSQSQLEQEGWQFQAEETYPNTVIINSDGVIVGDIRRAIEHYTKLAQGEISDPVSVILRGADKNLYLPIRVTVATNGRVTFNAVVLSAPNRFLRAIIDNNTLTLLTWSEFQL